MGGSYNCLGHLTTKLYGTKRTLLIVLTWWKEPYFDVSIPKLPAGRQASKARALPEVTVLSFQLFIRNYREYQYRRRASPDDGWTSATYVGPSENVRESSNWLFVCNGWLFTPARMTDDATRNNTTR